MRDIKSIGFMIMLSLGVFLCSCEDDNGTSETKLDVSFIRFSFQTNSNNEPIQFPDSGVNETELSSYLLNRRDTLKLPVVLSSPNIDGTIQASYSANFNNVSESDLSIFSKNTLLSFEANQLSDTIYIVPNQRLKNLNQASIDFQITSVSDSEVNIGYPNEEAPLDNFTLNLADFEPIAYELSTSSLEIDGIEGENYTIDIAFNQIVNPEDVNDVDWLSTDFIQTSCSDELNFNFDFNLEILALESPGKSLSYSFQILENFEDISTNLNVRLQHIESQDFSLRGQSLIQFFKSGKVPERFGDPAAPFYNVTNRFHRTYGKAWFFDENRKECIWQDFQSFTRPVEVEPGSEFDNGSGFHSFKIGFRNTIRNINGDIIGTNPFNLRRFYDGASVLSPAFNQVESLEFFPEDNQQGTVRVSIQNLEFLVDGETLNIPVCGNGTYAYDIENDRWEIFLTVITDESQINGNSNATKFLYIYTELVDEDPEPLFNQECASTISL